MEITARPRWLKPTVYQALRKTLLRLSSEIALLESNPSAPNATTPPDGYTSYGFADQSPNDCRKRKKKVQVDESDLPPMPAPMDPAAGKCCMRLSAKTLIQGINWLNLNV